jgi:hypothetical protein
MMMHGRHFGLMCVAMLVIGVVLLVTGVGAIAIVPVLGCVVMMTLMMALMMGAISRGRHR